MVQRADKSARDHRLVHGIDHAGITVRSLERSLAFYHDLLGLRVIEISHGEEVGTAVGIPGARVNAADLDAGDGRILELVQYVAPTGEQVPQRPNGPGCPHVALRVRDIAAVLQLLADAGHHPDGQPTTVTGGIAWEGATVVYLRDPDGALVELIQRPEPNQASPATEADAPARPGRSTC